MIRIVDLNDIRVNVKEFLADDIFAEETPIADMVDEYERTMINYKERGKEVKYI